MHRTTFILLIVGGLVVASCAEIHYASRDAIVSVPPGQAVMFGNVEIARTHVRRMSLIPTRQLVAMGGDPDAAVPDSTKYLWLPKKSPFYEFISRDEYVVYEFYLGGKFTLRCPGLVLRVPPDADAVYSGYLVFHSESGGAGKRDRVALTIKDAFDDGVREFRRVQPEFHGKIAKALFTPPTAAAKKHIACSWHRKPINALELLFAPMMARP